MQPWTEVKSDGPKDLMSLTKSHLVAMLHQKKEPAAQSPGNAGAGGVGWRPIDKPEIRS